MCDGDWGGANLFNFMVVPAHLRIIGAGTGSQVPQRHYRTRCRSQRQIHAGARALATDPCRCATDPCRCATDPGSAHAGRTERPSPTPAVAVLH
eukprot:gene55057-27658_t